MNYRLLLAEKKKEGGGGEGNEKVVHFLHHWGRERKEKEREIASSQFALWLAQRGAPPTAEKKESGRIKPGAAFLSL